MFPIFGYLSPFRCFQYLKFELACLVGLKLKSAVSRSQLLPPSANGSERSTLPRNFKIREKSLERNENFWSILHWKCTVKALWTSFAEIRPTTIKMTLMSSGCKNPFEYLLDFIELFISCHWSSFSTVV